MITVLRPPATRSAIYHLRHPPPPRALAGRGHTPPRARSFPGTRGSGLGASGLRGDGQRTPHAAVFPPAPFLRHAYITSTCRPAKRDVIRKWGIKLSKFKENPPRVDSHFVRPGDTPTRRGQDFIAPRPRPRSPDAQAIRPSLLSGAINVSTDPLPSRDHPPS